MHLYKSYFDSPIGEMISIASDKALFLLEFTERKALKPEIERLQKNTRASVVKGSTIISKQIESELEAYFAKELFQFKTPIQLLGTDFQKHVWQTLRTIPAGQTYSYAELAQSIGRNKAYRAVAKANSTNQLAIIVPCHRVINANGNLGGYAAGVERKQWLLTHEGHYIRDRYL